MKRILIVSLTAGLALSFPWMSFAEDKQGNLSQSIASQAKPELAVKPVLYVPPKKGAPAPGLKRGGGTRGMNKSVPMISVLAPDHVGLTLLEQPVLYWFAPTKQNLSYEFTLIAETADSPAVEVKLPQPTHPGIQQIRLSDYNVKLSSGERYQWSVAVIMDPEEPSANIVAKGIIERVDRNKLEQPLPSGFSKADAPKHYAESGVWYDAVMAFSDQIQSDPGNMDLRQQRALLLEQGGLGEVAVSMSNMRSPSAY
ncbi:MAG: DUF928 domain-containing protein [Nitrospira sp.]|nr:DUF928 domain-containing protein [Nitrospira sp.]